MGAPFHFTSWSMVWKTAGGDAGKPIGPHGVLKSTGAAGCRIMSSHRWTTGGLAWYLIRISLLFLKLLIYANYKRKFHSHWKGWRLSPHLRIQTENPSSWLGMVEYALIPALSRGGRQISAGLRPAWLTY